MDMAQVVDILDELLFEKTGSHLDFIQKSVLEGTLQDKTYSEIAVKSGYSESHVGDTASDLWKILSELLGEKVRKANVKAILEQTNFNQVSGVIVSGIVGVTNNISVCNKTNHPKNNSPSTQKISSPKLHLNNAPKFPYFYSRNNELSTLKDWVINQEIRLITILGISGIGKTTLSLSLIDRIKTQFDYVIYRSLRFSPTLDATLTNLLQIFSQQSEIPQNIETKIAQILDYLRKNRCLIVLDDVQMLFGSGQLAGQYKTGYEDYQLFFKLIAEVCHQSCLILNSWEKPREIARLSKDNHPVRCFVLGSLGEAAKEILKSQKLSDEETWETLIDIYQGNPLWLEFTATLIQELFGGRVSEFLQCEMPILDEGLQSQLSQPFGRLTAAELAVMVHLANQAEPVAVSQILNKIPFSPSEIVNAVRSLGSRFLLDAVEEEKVTLFSLNSVVKQYVKTQSS